MRLSTLWYALLGALALVLLAGCQSFDMSAIGDFIGTAVKALGPTMADIVASTAAASVADAVNQAASGNPIGPEELQSLKDGFGAAITTGIEQGMAASEAGKSPWDSVLSGFTGALGGGVTGYMVGNKKGKATDPSAALLKALAAKLEVKI